MTASDKLKVFPSASGSNATSTHSPLTTAIPKDDNVFVPVLEYTPVEEIPTIVDQVRTAYMQDVTKSLGWRKHQLRQLWKMLDENEDLLASASFKDHRKNPGEVIVYDIMPLKNEIADALANIDAWTKPETVSGGVLFALDKCQVRREPFGVALVIGAWNYPYQLLLGPAAAAITAGNAVVLKPSEVAEHAAAAVSYLLPRYLDTSCIRVVNGAIPETTRLLEQKFDHIFYTGNGHVGKIVMSAAAKYLTPVVLELGGKSPVFVDETANIDIAAKRIMWAKTVNCGQTCIAPDYILITSKALPKFTAACASALQELYGRDLRNTTAYPRIISQRQYDRLEKVVEEQKKTPGCKVAVGGFMSKDDLYIEPTVMTGVGKHDSIMQDEIFGPLLPVIEIADVNEAVDYIRSRHVDKPLALYVFSHNRKAISTILERCDSGNAMVNDLLMNMAVSTLPFGGVGPSGMGKYHGKHGFDAYTHARSVMIRPAGLEFMWMVRYPIPGYSPRALKLARFLMQHNLPGPVMQSLISAVKALPWNIIWWMACVALGVVIGWFANERRG
ncbi:Aldehyde dehydrogenase [Gaertneriomyces sp. JEL0708]|nr:Aldehyde dehydrogenase [Gaertneriomyces sp. JEL0708]